MRRTLALCTFVFLLVALPSFGGTAVTSPPPGGGIGHDTASICDGVAGNLVMNCGFETGDFTGWSLTGNTGYTGVYGSPYNNSGNYGAYLGPIGSDGFLSQTITDAPGATLDLSFWLENEYYGPDEFSVQWDGTTILNLGSNLGPFGYTNYNVAGLPGTGSDTLQFTYYQTPSYFGLDDVVVIPTTIPEPNPVLLLSTALLGLLGWQVLVKRSF